MQDVNWTYIRCSEKVLDVLWTSWIQFNYVPVSPVEILPNLKKMQRNLQYTPFCAEFYEEFNGASYQIFPLGQKKLWAKV